MRVLCCLDGTNAKEIAAATGMLLSTSRTLGLLHVIDAAPRKEMELTRERFLRPWLPRAKEMVATEGATAQEILDEGLQHLPGAEVFRREGRPEREIVNLAAEWRADLVLVCACTQYGPPVIIGPRSLGHVARFVVDHAPCPVLLVRPPAGQQFPIER
jgi:nucleotide-binding universal stress UspA family protein